MKAYKIYVVGMVQGVGFRPFIKRIAELTKVYGYVKNLGGGEVEIHVESNDESSINKFMSMLMERKPPPARLKDIEVIEVKPLNFKNFTILRSGRERLYASEIPQDLAVCPECMREVLNPRSRWYRYPFNSCAWCGPRYSMMYNPPYDRENTSMRDFPLCDECKREYEDLWNERRYHAQGISCPRCGPRLTLLDGDLRKIEVSDPLKAAADLIDSGKIVAVKGIGGFHIACLASSDEVVLELRRRKKRSRKPFALMALNLEIAKRLVEIEDENVEKLMTSYVKPIMILPRKTDSPASRFVAPGLNTLGIMLPYTPLHYLLLMETRDKFLIMTSGNVFGDPMISDDPRIHELIGIVDYVLTHNRKIVNRVDDSVIRPTYGGFMILRCGRGIAPKLLNLPFKLKDKIIAYGAELQTAGAIGFDDKIVLAPFSGDTDNPLVLRDHESSIRYLMKSYGFDGDDLRIVADLHPRYSSRKAAEKLAEKRGFRLQLIQHHFSHMASVMAERGHDPEKPAVGVIMDGVGYGLDGAIWGGEIIAWDGSEFRRLGRLEYHVMPGGDLATKYPLRMLASIMLKIMDEDEVTKFFEKMKFLEKMRYGLKELEACLRIVKEEKGPKTSSTGRFLDSVSALLGICFERTYEGEPAISLEENSVETCEIADVRDILVRDGENIEILTSEILRILLDELNTSSKGELAYTAQYLLGKALGEAASSLAEKFEVKELYVSGGAAVNHIILRGLADGSGLRILVNREIPANDGGIAVGQVYAAGLMEDLD